MPKPTGLALKLTELSKTYRNGVQAIKQVDLAVPNGDFCALLGPNGAGKSTIIGIICSLIRPSHGQAIVNQYDITRQAALAKLSLGVMPQEINLAIFETPLQILIQQAGYFGIPYRTARHKAIELLNQVGLSAQQNQQVRSLSGGMKRRLMVARALVHDPQIIMLDEPTAGVDIEIRQQLWQIFGNLHASGKTILLTTHYLEEAEQLCHHVAIINQGEIIIHDSMSHVLAQLKQQILVVETSSPITAPLKIPGVQLEQQNSNTLKITIPAEKSINDLFESLRLNNIEIHAIKNHKSRLEQLFTHLVNGKQYD